MGIFNHVLKENNRSKSVTLKNGVPTRWTSWYEESTCANMNQVDLGTGLN